MKHWKIFSGSALIVLIIALFACGDGNRQVLETSDALQTEDANQDRTTQPETSSSRRANKFRSHTGMVFWYPDDWNIVPNSPSEFTLIPPQQSRAAESMEQYIILNNVLDAESSAYFTGDEAIVRERFNHTAKEQFFSPQNMHLAEHLCDEHPVFRIKMGGKDAPIWDLEFTGAGGNVWMWRTSYAILDNIVVVFFAGGSPEELASRGKDLTWIINSVGAASPPLLPEIQVKHVPNQVKGAVPKKASRSSKKIARGLDKELVGIWTWDNFNTIGLGTDMTYSLSTASRLSLGPDGRFKEYFSSASTDEYSGISAYQDDAPATGKWKTKREKLEVRWKGPYAYSTIYYEGLLTLEYDNGEREQYLYYIEPPNDDYPKSIFANSPPGKAGGALWYYAGRE